MIQLIFVLLLLFVPTIVSAQTAAINRKAIDCAALTDGKPSHICFDTSLGSYFQCIPDSGNTCESPSDWVQTKAVNMSGTPALPNGTTATTQSQADNTTKLATTAYVDTGLGAVKTLASPSTDHSYSGLIASLTAGETLAQNEIVYIKSDGKYWKAKADVATTIPAVGFATAAISANAAGNILLQGYFRDDSWSWTVGGLLYVSPSTGGALTQTRPSTTGHQIQIVGYAVSATVIYFNPNSTYVEI